MGASFVKIPNNIIPENIREAVIAKKQIIPYINRQINSELP
jgi:hypothetical protein